MRRRQFLQAAGAGVLSLAAGCIDGLPARSESTDAETPTTDAIPEPTHDGGWPMADFSASAPGHNPDGTTAAPSSTTGDAGDGRWKLSFGEFESFREPVADHQYVYLPVVDWAETPSTSMLRAHALADGNVEWERQLPDAWTGTPARGKHQGDSALFVVSGQDESNTDYGHGTVLGLDPASGDRLWEQSYDLELRGSPVYDDGRVFVTGEAMGDGGVYALDADSGEEDWYFDTPHDPHNVPTVAGGTVFVNSDREELAALDAETGDVVWRTSARGDNCRPVVNQPAGLVYVGHTHGLQAFEAASGDDAWSFDVTDESMDSSEYRGVVDEPVVADGTLFVRTSDTSPFAVGDPGNLYALDAASGDQQWKLDDGRPDSTVVGANGHALLNRASAENASTGPMTDPPSGDLVCLTADAETAWTGETWAPIAVTDSQLLCYSGSPFSSSPSTFAALSTE